jgi:hypothetical protein
VLISSVHTRHEIATGKKKRKKQEEGKFNGSPITQKPINKKEEITLGNFAIHSNPQMTPADSGSRTNARSPVFFLLFQPPLAFSFALFRLLLVSVSALFPS